MFLNSVVLIFQETLEAAILMSVLLVFARINGIRPAWVVIALAAGITGAFVFALNMADISDWFDYVGQEVMNAMIQLMIILCLAVFTALQSLKRRVPVNRPQNLIYITCMVAIISLAMTREGSEIFIYIGMVFHQPEILRPTLTGAGIGAGIGISCGTLLYFGLLGLPPRWTPVFGLLLLAIVSGNFASQAILHLTQADWLPYSKILWDSSAWLPEESLQGHLLYAFFGYEATPSLYQVIAYVTGMLLIGLSTLIGYWAAVHAKKTQNQGVLIK